MPAVDVVIAGAGPAGTLAGITLARAGARVVLLDRDTFPRHKLCCDTLNPGGMAFLRSMVLLVVPYIGTVMGARKGEWLEPARLS